MKRRDFVAGLIIASAMRRAVAQQPAKAKRIAWLSPAAKVADMTANKYRFYRAFLEELKRLGYLEGENLVLDRYSFEGRRERYAELARDVVGTRPDVILAPTGPLAMAFKSATTEIPIVTVTADPIAIGLTLSLAHPAGTSPA